MKKMLIVERTERNIYGSENFINIKKDESINGTYVSTSLKPKIFVRIQEGDDFLDIRVDHELPYDLTRFEQIVAEVVIKNDIDIDKIDGENVVTYATVKKWNEDIQKLIE